MGKISRLRRGPDEPVSRHPRPDAHRRPQQCHHHPRLGQPARAAHPILGGDAAIGMTGMDIETAARNRIAILTIVFNNGVMAAERDVLKVSTRKYGALSVGGNYAKVAEGLNVAATRVETPAQIVPAIKDAVAVTESGAPFLLEFVVKEGYDFSRYELAGL